MPTQVIPTEYTSALSQAENLPSLPFVAVEVLRLTQDDECTIDRLAGVLQSDPALAARLLMLSNSSLFNLGQEVTTLQRATMVLGMKTVKLMSLSFSLATSIPKDGGGEFDLATYWRRSLVAAVAGKSLARLVGSKYGDEAFLCGLLSHLGQLVMSRCLPEVYAPVLEAADERWPTIALEEKLLGFTSADIAETLLEQWELPELIRLPIAYLNRPNQLPAEATTDVRRFTFLMAVTGLVVTVLCEPGTPAASKKLYELMERRFEVGERELDAWLIGLESGIRETAEMLNVDLPDDMNHRAMIEQARKQMVSVSLGTSADLRVAERRADDLSVRNQELLQKATRDKLTGLPNRAAFDETLAREIEARREPGVPRCLGLIMIDVDKFKNFNDAHGHQAGDAVLAVMGDVLAQLTRKGDLAARYGGEEFALILPATTPGHMKMIAERVRAAVEARVIPYEGQDLKVTASFGGACLEVAGGPMDASALIKAADERLYAAKEGGRNRVEIRADLLDETQPEA